MENARAVIAAYMRERMKADDVASRTVGKAITKALEELPPARDEITTSVRAVATWTRFKQGGRLPLGRGPVSRDL